MSLESSFNFVNISSDNDSHKVVEIESSKKRKNQSTDVQKPIESTHKKSEEKTDSGYTKPDIKHMKSDIDHKKSQHKEKSIDHTLNNEKKPNISEPVKSTETPIEEKTPESTVPPFPINLPLKIDVNKPVVNFKYNTVSVAIPSSILSNAQTRELRSYLVGEIARSLTIFGVDEVVIFNDEDPKWTKSLNFFVTNLRYLECPQYLRKALFKISADLAFSGLQNPIAAPHHLKIHEWSEVREGVICDVKRGETGAISLRADVGFKSRADVDVVGEDCLNYFNDKDLTRNSRISVQFYKGSSNRKCSGKLFLPENKRPLYDGYSVRAALNFQDIFDSSVLKYDLIIGTSDKGKSYKNVQSQMSDKINNVNGEFKHVLICFGGLNGLEPILSANEKKPKDVFDFYVNTCPDQKSRTIRTEEAILLTLCSMNDWINTWKK